MGCKSRSGIYTVNCNWLLALPPEPYAMQHWNMMLSTFGNGVESLSFGIAGRDTFHFLLLSCVALDIHSCVYPVVKLSLRFFTARLIPLFLLLLCMCFWRVWPKGVGEREMIDKSHFTPIESLFARNGDAWKNRSFLFVCYSYCICCVLFVWLSREYPIPQTHTQQLIPPCMYLCTGGPIDT